jgi:hypothetical protein
LTLLLALILIAGLDLSGWWVPVAVLAWVSSLIWKEVLYDG